MEQHEVHPSEGRVLCVAGEVIERPAEGFETWFTRTAANMPILHPMHVNVAWLGLTNKAADRRFANSIVFASPTRG